MENTPEGWWSTSIHRFGLVAAAALAGVAALRWSTIGHPLLYLLVPLAPVLLLPALLLVAATSYRRGQRPASSVALAGAIALLVTALPGGFPPRLRCGTVDDAALTIYSHNVAWGEGDPEEVGRQLESVEADVVLLQEGDPSFVDRLQSSLGDPYPFARSADSASTKSLAILSRWPITDVEDTSHVADTMNPFLIATIASPDRYRLANAHLSAPTVTENLGRRRSELAFLGSPGFVDQGIDAVIGDFNASSAHADYRSALDGYWADATAARGCSLGGTWSPLGTGPGLLTLDRVLVSTAPGHDLGAVAVRTLGYAGNDHRAVLVQLARPEDG